jgi:hypothetical protein
MWPLLQVSDNKPDPKTQDPNSRGDGNLWARGQPSKPLPVFASIFHDQSSSVEQKPRQPHDEIFLIGCGKAQRRFHIDLRTELMSKLVAIHAIGITWVFTLMCPRALIPTGVRSPLYLFWNMVILRMWIAPYT